MNQTSPPPDPQPRVLVVDDEAGYRKSIARFLELDGSEVRTAAEAEEAFQLLQDQDFDCVVTDIIMPRITGVDLLHRLKEISPRVPVILITGEPTVETAVHAVHLGASDYVTKPFARDAIVKAVRNAVRIKRLEDENIRYRDRLEELVAEQTEKIRNYSERLRRIAENTKEFALCRDELELADRVLELLAQNLAVSGGSIYLKRDDRLELIASLDPGHQAREVKLPPPPNSVLGKLIEQREAFRVADIRNDQTYETSGWSGYTDGSLLALPLRDGESEIIGVITLHNKTSPPFTEQDVELGMIIASHSLEALRNVELTNSLRESERRYRLLAENASDVIWTTDLELNLTYISPSITALTGYPVEEAMDRKLGEAVTPESMERVGKVLAEEMQAERNGRPRPEQPLIVEVEILRKDGGRVTAEVTARFIRDPQGKPLGVIGAARDVTARQRAEKERDEMERQFHHAQKLEAIGTLASGISHDFNNILAIIIGNAELLLLKQKFEDPENKKDLELILEAALRARDLISQILVFSRKDESRKQPFDVNVLLKETAKMIRPLIPSTIHIHARPLDDPCMIHADPTKLQQVILNLCSNSAHAMKESGGDLTVGLDRVAMGTENDAGAGVYCRLTIADTGPGIDPAIADRVFEPFFTTKQPGEGTGLGLSVVHGIVKDHGGRIEIDSGDSGGAAFHVYLPVIENSDQTDANGDLGEMPRGSERLLIVDDDADMLRTVARILGQLGYHVVDRNSSSEALRLFKQNPQEFDLVLTDQVMPDLVGDALAREIQREKTNTPVIIYSAGAEPWSPEQLRKLGIRKRLLKPISLSELAHAIREVLDAETIN